MVYKKSEGVKRKDTEVIPLCPDKVVITFEQQNLFLFLA